MSPKKKKGVPRGEADWNRVTPEVKLQALGIRAELERARVHVRTETAKRILTQIELDFDGITEVAPGHFVREENGVVHHFDKRELKKYQRDAMLIYRGTVRRKGGRLVPEIRLVGKPRTALVERAPGWRFIGVMGVVISPKNANYLFGQTVKDINEEYIAALAAGKTGLARWVRIRGYGQLTCLAFMAAWATVIKKFIAIWKLIP